MLSKAILNPNLNKKYMLVKRLLNEHRKTKEYEDLLMKVFTHGKDLKGISSLNDLKKFEKLFNSNFEEISQFRRKAKHDLGMSKMNFHKGRNASNISESNKFTRQNTAEFNGLSPQRFLSPVVNNSNNQARINNSTEAIINLNLAKQTKFENVRRDDIEQKSFENACKSYEYESKFKSRRYKLSNLKALKFKFCNKVGKDIIIPEQKQSNSVINNQNDNIKSRNTTLNITSIEKSQSFSKKYSAIKLLNDELKVNQTLQAGRREQEKYVAFIDKINQIYNFPKQPCLMSRASRLRLSNTYSPSKENKLSQTEIKNPIKIIENESSNIKSKILPKLKLKKYSLNPANTNGSIDLNSNELNELQMKQERIINKNLQKILNFDGIGKLDLKHRKILKGYNFGNLYQSLNL